MIKITNEQEIEWLFQIPDKELSRLYFSWKIAVESWLEWVHQVLEFLFSTDWPTFITDHYSKRRQYAIEQGMPSELVELYAKGSLYTSQNIASFRARRWSWKPKKRNA